MTIQFTASPDFPPKLLSGWFFLNTWFQHVLNQGVHFEPYDDFETQHQAINNDQVDIIYANPFDAAFLIREKGFIPLVKPANKSDEAIILVANNSTINSLEDIQQSNRIACTVDPDVYMMCQIMLEPAALNQQDLKTKKCDTYIQVAKALMQNECQLGFFLLDAYNDLSSMVKSQLRQLITSDIQVIHHVLMISPKLSEQRDVLSQALIEMKSNPKDLMTLEALEISSFEDISQDEAEMMIDLMDTLNEYPIPS